MKRLLPILALLSFLLLACNEDPPTQRLPDTGGSNTADTDAPDTSAADAGSDTATDTGPAVECTSGVDCDSGVCDADSGECLEATCEDGVQNQDEADIDCGGDTCESCEVDDSCGEADDCASGVCEQGTCAAPDCEDGVQNGGESDVDCGGDECAGCANQKSCESGGDCQSGVCDDESDSEAPVCVEPTCMDGVKNANETDVDCGGADSGCAACQPMKNCSESGDCRSGVCEMGQCQAPSCDDGIQNGSETGEDCGGADSGMGCGACQAGEGCQVAEDCQSGVCSSDGGMSQTCQTATCTDGVKNGAESDVDCGGMMCQGCGAGASCGGQADCASGVCKGGACAAPTCSDGVKNGDETAADCGGKDCGACPAGQSCQTDGDCTSSICQMGTCAAASCMDGVKNAGESDVDCGGPACGACPVGKSCDDGGDCVSQVCKQGACAAPTCNDLKQNGRETDVDCGGGSCPTCRSGGACQADADCKSGVCTNNICQAPTCTDGVKNQGETDVDCGGASSGCTACAVGDSCRADADCATKICVGGTCGECRPDGKTRSTNKSCGYKGRGSVEEVCTNNRWTRKACNGVWYASCKEIQADRPMAGDGTYTIDPDGPSGSAYSPMQVECDMTTRGGGWTRVAFEDFSSATSGWSTTNKRTTCGSYGTILGGYRVIAGGTNAKTYQLKGVPHSRTRLTLRYVKIDSWGSSGEEGFVKLGGSEIWRQEYCACRHGCQMSGGICGGKHICGMRRSGAAEVDDMENDAAVDGVINHSGNSVRVEAGATLDQAPDDESWGLDDVAVWVK